MLAMKNTENGKKIILEINSGPGMEDMLSFLCSSALGHTITVTIRGLAGTTITGIAAPILVRPKTGLINMEPMAVPLKNHPNFKAPILPKAAV